ncbi:MAG: ATP-binding protein [Acidobacteriaceae bacterium]
MDIALAVIAPLFAACVFLLIAYGRARKQIVKLAAQTQQALRMTMQQQQMLREHTHAGVVKDEFIATVSHELRTPLTSIRGSLGLLSAMPGQTDPKAQNLLRIALSNTERLVRLINDILDLARMESDHSSLRLQRCSLPELIVQAVETMTPMADAAEVYVEVFPARGETILFNGDPDRILQLLCNLLSNAVKFSPPGASIRVQTSVIADDFVLRIEDRGRGIPAEQLESVFDRFQQVEDSDSKTKGGTGLGLAICRGIAVQHGGAIWAERNDTEAPGHLGSSFILQLPRLTTLEDNALAPAQEGVSGLHELLIEPHPEVDFGPLQ